MHIGILGTGNMAQAIAEGWTRAGHQVLIAGRSEAKARTLADSIGPAARMPTPQDAARRADAILLAVAWDGVEEMLRLAHAPGGSMHGKTLIDSTNAVDYQTFTVKPGQGSAAETVASLATGANVVKALHLFAGQSWLQRPTRGATTQTVAMCGDDQAALATASDLVRALGGTPAVVGTLQAARQLEDVAGFVMRLAAAGFDPATAVPAIQPRIT